MSWKEQEHEQRRQKTHSALLLGSANDTSVPHMTLCTTLIHGTSHGQQGYFPAKEDSSINIELSREINMILEFQKKHVVIELQKSRDKHIRTGTYL